MTIFATLTPIDLGTNTRVTVRVCASQDVAATGAGGERWWPAMVTLPVIQRRFFDGDFTSSVEPATASIDVRLDVLMSSGAFPRVERYDWAGASCLLQRLSGGVLVDVQLMQVESFASDAMVLGLRLRAAGDLYDAEVLRSTYAGTTGAEGGADLKGQLKPWVFGRALNVEPVFIDQIDNVFQVSGYGPVQAISAVYERGSSFGASIGDFATYAALVAATIPPGRWATCLAQGMFRLGAPPAGVITCDVDGDSTGGFLRRTGAILSQIATRIGLVDKVNSVSITALDTEVPRNVNIVIREQTTFIELAQRMLAPCNAVASVGPSGRLIASRVSFGSEQFTLDAQGREMPPVLNMSRQNTSAPYKRVQMGAARSWRVHTFDEIAFYGALIDRGLYEAATTYREGNIVERADKSRWVYTNPTPSAGNAPPTWPTASNAFWSNIAPPLAPEAIGLESGATRNVPRGTYAAGTTYVRGDSVLFNGSAYQLIVASSTGNPPPDVARWALVANAGSGPAGADGLPGLTVIVSNEAHVVATAPDGSGGDYSAAGGQMRLLRGTEVLAATFSIAAATPATGWITINSTTGVYTVTDPGVDLATATIRATWQGVNYDRTYTLAKSKQGVTGPRLALVADNQAFTFTDGAANPGSQTITLTALLNNLSGTATWSTTPAVTLGGTGNTRTLSVASFGANRQVTVEATLGGITDRITIVRLERDVSAPANANRVPLSLMEGNAGWNAFSNSPSGASVSYFTFEGRRVAFATANASAAGQFINISCDPPNQGVFPVVPGERLSVQARLGDPTNVTGLVLNFGYVRANGTYDEITVLGVPPQGWLQSPVRGFVDVPSDARLGTIRVYAFAAGAGSYTLLMSEPMVTSAAAGQTVHPPFSPGPVLTGPIDAGGPLLIGQLPTDKAAPGLQNALVPLGNSNRMPFSRFEGGSGWAAGGAPAGGQPFLIVFDGRYFISAEPVYSAANQDHFLFNAPRIPVIPGERFSVSARVQAFGLPGGADPSFWQLFCEYYDALVGGTNLGNTPIANGTSASFEGALLSGFSTVPAGARAAQLVLLYKSSAAGPARLAILEPMVTSASAVQTVHPPFSPGPNGVDGATRNTGALNADGLNAVDAGGPLLIGQLPPSKADPGLVNTNVPLGSNAVVNSEFTRGKFGWRAGNGALDSQWGVNLTGTPNWFGQRNVMWMTAPGAFAINSVRDLSPNALWEGGGLPNALQFAMPVVAGDRLAASVLGAQHRCTIQLYILIFDGAGTLISAPVVGGGTPGGAANGDPANFTRLTNFADAPANARWAIPMMRLLGTGESDPFIFFTEPLLSKVAAGQTTAPRYTPGRADSLADETATAQRSIEPQFPVIEIKQGEAGNSGTRTVTHTAKRGTATLTGGTWSLPSTNVPGSTITVNSSTGTVSLSGVATSGAYTIRYTHGDGVPTELPVNVTYVAAAAGGVVSAKTGRATSQNGTENDSLWQTILTLTITGCPTGRVTFGGIQRLSSLDVSTATGTADFEARLQMDGVTLSTTLPQNVVSGGVVSFADFSELFGGSYAVNSGTRTFTIQLRRTDGDGRILSTLTVLEATIIAT